MSAFLCGEIVINKKMMKEKQIDLTWNIIEIGIKYKIYFQFGFGIVQNIIYEILQKQTNTIDFNYSIPFFIPDSPLNNVSEELIDICYIPKHSQDFAPLITNFEKLSFLIKDILTLQDVERIELVFCEGYDEDIPSKKVSLKDFVNICIDYYKDWQIPSVKFIFEKQN